MSDLQCDAPKRIQRSRAKGWRMPENTVPVSRPGKWGSPFNFRAADYCWTALAFGCRGDAAGRQEASVKAYRQWVDDPQGRIAEWEFGVVWGPGNGEGPTVPVGARVKVGAAPSLEEIRRELRGKNLACWCALDKPCHADVLLDLANRP